MRLREVVLAVLLALLAVLIGTANAQESSCAETTDFELCKDGFTRLVFPRNDVVEIYQDRLVFVAAGVVHRFADQQRSSDARDAAMHCIAVPADTYDRVKKISDNWRMKSSTDYWECLMAQQKAWEIQASLLKRHKDFRNSLYNNVSYAKAVIEFLEKHFGDARFDVYSLDQQEQAYRALHKQKWE